MTKQLMLTIAGFALLGLGVVGAALPVLPTTPFVLLSAICFSGSSKRFSAWLQKSRFFGSYIENYRTKRGVEKKVKLQGIVFLWVGLIVSMVLVQKPLMYVILGIVGACVTAHILLLKTRKEERDNEDRTAD